LPTLEDAPLQIYRFEGIAVVDQHLRLTQKQKATFIEGEGKSGDNFRLGFSIEIPLLRHTSRSIREMGAS